MLEITLVDGQVIIINPAHIVRIVSIAAGSMIIMSGDTAYLQAAHTLQEMRVKLARIAILVR